MCLSDVSCADVKLSLVDDSWHCASYCRLWCTIDLVFIQFSECYTRICAFLNQVDTAIDTCHLNLVG